LQLTPQLAISCLLQSRFWYASSCLSTSFLNALQLTPQLAISCFLQSRFWYVSSYFLFYFPYWTKWSFQLFCASWTKVLLGTLLTEHPFNILMLSGLFVLSAETGCQSPSAFEPGFEPS